MKTYKKNFIFRFHVALARAEIDLRDRFDGGVLDTNDKIYATSRKMEIINEISPICSLTGDIQDKVLGRYDRVKNVFAKKIGYTGNDNKEDSTLFALVSLVMVPTIKTMISKLTFVVRLLTTIAFIRVLD